MCRTVWEAVDVLNIVSSFWWFHYVSYLNEPVRAVTWLAESDSGELVFGKGKSKETGLADSVPYLDINITIQCAWKNWKHAIWAVE